MYGTFNFRYVSALDNPSKIVKKKMTSSDNAVSPTPNRIYKKNCGDTNIWLLTSYACIR